MTDQELDDALNEAQTIRKIITLLRKAPEVKREAIMRAVTELLQELPTQG